MLVITGLARSGTSALARLAHQAGICMGTQMYIPTAGTEPEWEDIGIVHALAVAVLDKKNPAPDFSAYFKQRMCHSAEEGNGFWGFKSPQACLFQREIEAAAAEHEEPVYWASSIRPPSEVLASIERVRALVGDRVAEELLHTNELISPKLEFMHRSFLLSMVRDFPITIASELMEMLGMGEGPPADVGRGILPQKPFV